MKPIRTSLKLATEVRSQIVRNTNARLRTIALVALVAMVGPGIGNAQDSVIAGTADADELTGTVGDDTINGRGGADVMTGLAGNDTYIVDDEADQVVEQCGEGNDTVRIFWAYDLPPCVNNLIVAGSQDGGGYGNKLANRMVGNSGSNALNGGPGNDTLTGRGGRDTFVFNSALNASTNVDRVTDFTVGVDSLELFWTAFPAFMLCDYHAAPALAPSKLHIGASATTDSHRIVYNPNSGALYYDSDGSGPTLAVRFATLSPDLALTGDDFYIISRPGTCP